jgi:hypothetical protein
MALKCGAAVAAFAAALPAAAAPGRLGPAASSSRRPAPSSRPTPGWPARAAPARAMAAELPEVLDLLHVAVGAGLPALRALGEVGRRRGGPLARELRARRRAALGVPHAQALERLARRCPLHGVAAAGRRHRALASATARRWRPRCARWPPTRAPSAPSACASARPAPRPRSSSWSRCCSCPPCMLLVGACLSAPCWPDDAASRRDRSVPSRHDDGGRTCHGGRESGRERVLETAYGCSASTARARSASTGSSPSRAWRR